MTPTKLQRVNKLSNTLKAAMAVKAILIAIVSLGIIDAYFDTNQKKE